MEPRFGRMARWRGRAALSSSRSVGGSHEVICSSSRERSLSALVGGGDRDAARGGSPIRVNLRTGILGASALGFALGGLRYPGAIRSCSLPRVMSGR
jgi:hypothetical protein